MSKISAAHVSAVLGKKHERASEPSGAQSGFVVSSGPAGSHMAVTVAYQDYDYGLSNAEQARAALISEKAFDEYAATLRRAGYVTEDWLRYDGVRLGLFVTGKK